MLKCIFITFVQLDLVAYDVLYFRLHKILYFIIIFYIVTKIKYFYPVHGFI